MKEKRIMFRILRVQLIHQNGETHYINFKTDETVSDLERYRKSIIDKYHAQKVNLTYSVVPGESK